MPGDQTLLGDLRFPALEIRCTRCPRAGRLIAEHGPQAGLVDLARHLCADCPNRDAPVYERCDVWYPTLAAGGAGGFPSNSRNSDIGLI